MMIYAGLNYIGAYCRVTGHREIPYVHQSSAITIIAMTHSSSRLCGGTCLRQSTIVPDFHSQLYRQNSTLNPYKLLTDFAVC